MFSTLGRLLKERAGYSMAWWGIVILFAGVPLASLAIDTVRFQMVQATMQTAVDAACEAAAQTVDLARFKDTGIASIDEFRAQSKAHTAFRQTVSDAGAVRYAPRLKSMELLHRRIVHFEADAFIEPIIPASDTMFIKVEANCEMRMYLIHFYRP